MTEYYVGRRLSYEGDLCTVRYRGPVDGTQGEWLGVEWDEDQSRGKHDGTYKGREYFTCRSNSLTAASFIRPSRKSDKPLSFLDALRQKYVSSEPFGIALSDEIKISGKTVEEIGFDKIRQQQATLQELRVVILDGLRIAGIEDHPGGKTWSRWSRWSRLTSQGLSFIELDLSRNLLEEWYDVVGICAASRTESLRTLKLEGNQFRDLAWPSFPDCSEWENPFPKVAELSLSATNFSWQNIEGLLPRFPSLAILNLSSNRLGTLKIALHATQLTELDLSSNTIRSLWDISPLGSLPKLQKLSLRSNPIYDLEATSSKTDNSPLIFPALRSLDLTSTRLPALLSLDPVATIFPALTSLLIRQTPLTHFTSSKLFTIARLPTLTELNYSTITTAERQEAELYYLSSIAKQLGAAADSLEEDQVLKEHPRWAELCKVHGEPRVEKMSTEEFGSDTLGARVMEITFYMTHSDWTVGQREDLPSCESNGDQGLVEKTKAIPRTVDIYSLKGIVGRLFGLQPMSCKLIWETGEWDPVGGQEDEGWSVDEDESEDEHGGPSRELNMEEREQEQARDKGKWERREVELVDGTRELGFWVEGKKARIRVEFRDKL